jgi:hypothetical protein
MTSREIRNKVRAVSAIVMLVVLAGSCSPSLALAQAPAPMPRPIPPTRPMPTLPDPQPPGTKGPYSADPPTRPMPTLPDPQPPGTKGSYSAECETPLGWCAVQFDGAIQPGTPCFCMGDGGTVLTGQTR